MMMEKQCRVICGGVEQIKLRHVIVNDFQRRAQQCLAIRQINRYLLACDSIRDYSNFEEMNVTDFRLCMSS